LTVAQTDYPVRRTALMQINKSSSYRLLPVTDIGPRLSHCELPWAGPRLLKNGRTLGRNGRFGRLEPVVRRTFDIVTMARLSVGPSWATMSQVQRQQVTDGFGRYISATYAERFDSYSGQKLQVTDEQPAAAGTMVHSQIVKANGEPVRVDYLMRKNGDSWLIADIYLDGAISEVATRRSEFAAILKNEGIDGLIAALNRKANMLTSTTAKAF